MDYYLLFDIVFFISLTSAGLTLVVSLFSKHPHHLKFICLIIAISFLADLLSAIGSYLLEIYIPYVGSTYRVLELVIILEFYKRLFSGRWNTYLIWILQVVLPLFFLFVITYEPTPIRITNSVLFSVCAILYFRKLILELKMTNPLDFPLFWINAAILLYFSGSLFIFLFFDPLAELDTMAAVVTYIFHNIFLVVRNVLFAVGFWKVRKMARSRLTV